jgi:hypothetical protein
VASLVNGNECSDLGEITPENQNTPSTIYFFKKILGMRRQNHHVMVPKAQSEEVGWMLS